MLLSLYLDPLATFPDDFPQAVSVVWVAVGVVGRGDGAVGAPDEAPAVRLNADPVQLETPQPTLAVGHQPQVHGGADRGRVGRHFASAQLDTLIDTRAVFARSNEHLLQKLVSARPGGAVQIEVLERDGNVLGLDRLQRVVTTQILLALHRSHGREHQSSIFCIEGAAAVGFFLFTVVTLER